MKAVFSDQEISKLLILLKTSLYQEVTAHKWRLCLAGTNTQKELCPLKRYHPRCKSRLSPVGWALAYKPFKYKRPPELADWYSSKKGGVHVEEP